MLSNRDPAKQVVYAAARRFKDVALRRDGSLFSPDRSAWSASNLDDLYTRFNLAPDASSDSFETKFARQLADAPTSTIQLAAEVVYVHLLVARDIGGAAKRRLVDLVRGWAREPIEIPEDLTATFDTGVCNTGVAFKTYRPNQLWFLIEFMRAWKGLDRHKQDELLADAWACKSFAESVPQRAAHTQRQGLLHLLYPDAFEDMVSRDHKALIIAAFAPELSATLPEDPDRALAEIRRYLTDRFGEDFSFYDPPVRDLWRSTHEPPTGTDSTEPHGRRAWLLRGTEDGGSLVPDWLSRGYCSIGWRELGSFPADISRPELMDRLRKAYPDAGEGSLRNSAAVILKFLQSVAPTDVVLTPHGQDLYVGIIDGGVEYVADQPHQWRRPVEWANPQDPLQRSQVSPSLYSKLRTLLTLTDISENLRELESVLGPPRDVQVMTSARPTELSLARSTPDLAFDLNVDTEWLDEQIELLEAKRQLIFYGPPGTGKTYLAQAIADHITGDGGLSVLVQFHPSYSYEDFFEGFRPRSTGDTSIGFELVPGPLRRLADAARADRGHPYVLVVDEINRANVAKVFGELYFLLEYRDRSVSLQYSGEDEFQLPTNVFIIGTMNTVDRSIALVDAAMRRRFYFTPLLPDRAPVDQTLRRWLAKSDQPVRIADLLDALNLRIGDPEAAIGPSYFMQADIGDDRVLDRVWKHSILPQLEEYHYGAGIDVRTRYSIDSLTTSHTNKDTGSSG